MVSYRLRVKQHMSWHTHGSKKPNSYQNPETDQGSREDHIHIQNMSAIDLDTAILRWFIMAGT